jgi:hypothetical protein
MKFRALAITLTTLVLGASSVALADHTQAPPVIRDHRGPDLDPSPGDYRMRFRPNPRSWTELSGYAMSRFGRTVIDVKNPQHFRTLKLEAVRGATYVDRVLITFGNGQTQVVELEKMLSSRSPMLIDLDGRARNIDKIVVLGRTSRGNRYGYGWGFGFRHATAIRVLAM